MRKASRFWSEKTRDIKPYVAGEQPRDPKIIKLNTNENPYGPGPQVQAVLQAYAAEELRLYPDPENTKLRQALCEYYDLDGKQVFFGNGSDEILAFAFLAFFAPNRSAQDKKGLLQFPDVTYSFYPVYADLFEVPYETVALRDDFAIETDDFSAQASGLILANPNAPTGMALDLAAIESLLKANADRLVIVDEAYVDFGADSAVPLLARYDNLLIVSTLSKSRSLAGMRIGFALGDPALIEALERIRDSFNSYTVNRISQAVATAAIRSGAWFEKTRQQVIASRKWTAMKLSELGFSLTDSKANFLFIEHENWPAEALYQSLRKEGILVRHFKQARTCNHLRVSIGTEPDMKSFIACIAKIVNKDFGSG